MKYSYNMKSSLVMILLLASIRDCLPSRKGSDKSMRERSFGCLVKLFDGKYRVDCPKAVDLECPREEVTFWLTTQWNTDNHVKLDPLEPRGDFVPGAPLKVLIEGYNTNKDKGFLYTDLRPAYFERGKYNVISVDWGPLCKMNCYASAAVSVPTVGHCLADFLARLFELNPGVFGELHLLGTSLGAHIAAYASLEMPLLPRITMFDPALPMFSNRDSLYKKGMAYIVDVWHSNTRIFGRPTPDGTIDIYLNNGRDQPGCDCDIDCSHSRGMRVYAETITSKQPFLGFLCAGRWIDYRKGRCKMPTMPELARFGEDFTPGRTGVHLAFTNDRSPYIISDERYLQWSSFKAFKKTHDQRCYTHRTIAFFAKHFR